MKPIKLKEGLYSKMFSNGICRIDGKAYTFKTQAKTHQLIRIKDGKAYLTDNLGKICEELIPVREYKA